MNKNLICLVFLGMFLISLVNASVDYCYQESPNISNQSGNDGNCNQIYNGSYTIYGSAWIDGNWNTFTDIGNNKSIYVNYTIPNNTNIQSAYVNIKLKIDSNSIFIPQYCVQNNLRMNYTSRFTSPYTVIDISCYNYLLDKFVSIYNGSTSTSTRCGNSDTECQFFEEGINWSMPPTITLNYPTSLINYGKVNGTLQLNVTATDTSLDKVWYDYETYSYNYNSSLQWFDNNISSIGTYDDGIYYFTLNSQPTNGSFLNITKTHNSGELFVSTQLSLNGCTSDLIKVNRTTVSFTAYTNFSCGTQNLGQITEGGLGTTYWLSEVRYNKNLTATSGVSALSNITLSTKKNITIYANDTSGNLATETFSWDYKVFNTGESYSSSVYETQLNTFLINLTYDSNYPISVKLKYNGNNYSSTNIGSGNNGIFLVNTLNAPLVNSSSNKTFYWYIDYQDVLTSTEPTNQTVNPFYFIRCNSTYTVQSLNFTFYDEILQTSINASVYPFTILSNFYYWLGDGSIKKQYSFQNISSSLNNYQFCIYPNLTAYIDMDMQYYSNGTYAERTFYFRNESISNVRKDVILYSILETELTKFYVTVKQGTELFTNALVNVYKYFVGTGTYNLIGVGLTDSNGQFSINLDLDQDYNFTVIRDGYTYGSFIKSSSCSETPCTIDINIGDASLSGYEDLDNYFAQNIDYNFTYNKTSEIITLQFIDNLGTANYWRLLVYQTNYNNDSLDIICDSKLYSSSGILTCNYSGNLGDIIAKAYIDRNPEKLVDIIYIDNSNYSSIFGTSAILASIIIILVIIFSGTRNPTIALVLIPFALIVLKFIHLLQLEWGWIVGVSIFIAWIIGKMNT